MKVNLTTIIIEKKGGQYILKNKKEGASNTTETHISARHPSAV
jgi:hypothetical protein